MEQKPIPAFFVKDPKELQEQLLDQKVKEACSNNKIQSSLKKPQKQKKIINISEKCQSKWEPVDILGDKSLIKYIKREGTESFFQNNQGFKVQLYIEYFDGNGCFLKEQGSKQVLEPKQEDLKGHDISQKKQKKYTGITINLFDKQDKFPLAIHYAVSSMKIQEKAYIKVANENLLKRQNSSQPENFVLAKLQILEFGSFISPAKNRFPSASQMTESSSKKLQQKQQNVKEPIVSAFSGAEEPTAPEIDLNPQWENYYNVCEIENNFGKILFKNQRFEEALKKFKAADSQVWGIETQIKKQFTEKQNQQQKACHIKYALNIQVCWVKLQTWAKVLEVGKDILNLDSNNIKALFNMGNTQIALRNYSEAQNYFEQCLKIDPNNEDVKRVLKKQKEPQNVKTTDQKTKERDMCKYIFENFQKEKQDEERNRYFQQLNCQKEINQKKAQIQENLNKIETNEDAQLNNLIGLKEL